MTSVNAPGYSDTFSVSPRVSAIEGPTAVTMREIVISYLSLAATLLPMPSRKPISKLTPDLRKVILKGRKQLAKDTKYVSSTNHRWTMVDRNIW